MPPVVLLHGFPDSWRLGRHQVAALAAAGHRDRQLADLSRPGALEAGLNWYRANNEPALFPVSDPTRFSLPSVACPTLGVWSSNDPTLSKPR